ncbi:hypothetical protein [Marinitoga lauensis]|uniref:hypothetical protein n=1 Tax=Marinitoga lauensis TaxID=2201189 RepID=UPI0010128F36|nr:hypothetical protein [Marinitoga lauensis]
MENIIEFIIVLYILMKYNTKLTLIALTKVADVFIFDEATAHIDKEIKETIKRIIKEELKDKICFIITHEDDFDEAGDKILKLKNIEEVSISE